MGEWFDPPSSPGSRRKRVGGKPTERQVGGGGKADPKVRMIYADFLALAAAAWTRRLRCFLRSMTSNRSKSVVLRLFSCA